MAEAAAGHMIVAHLDHERGLEGLPGIFRPLIPAAWAARRGPSEPGRGDQLFQLFGQSWAVSAAMPEVKPTWWRRPSAS